MENLEKDIEYIILQVMAKEIAELNIYIEKDIIHSVKFTNISAYPKYEDIYMPMNTFLSIIKMRLFKQKGLKIVSYPHSNDTFCCKIEVKGTTYIQEVDSNEDRVIIKSIVSYLKYIKDKRRYKCIKNILL
jgi:hypothetical protein